jgi:hypothetical protein
VQLAGTVALLLPLLVRRNQWRRAEFRLHYLTLLLVYAVLFNHQAERPSFVIASAGVAIWCVTPPAGVKYPVVRAALAVLALVGLETLPLAVVWLAMQAELYGYGVADVDLPSRAPVGATAPSRHAVAVQGVPASADDASGVDPAVSGRS